MQTHRDFEFHSSIGAEHFGELQALLFFHPRQQMLIDSIRACVAEFGVPEIEQRTGRLYVGIPRNGAQGLIACRRGPGAGAPVAVVMYLRTSRELLRILHLAVHPAYERDGAHAGLGLGVAMVDAVRTLARRVAGVRRIQLPYVKNGYLAVPRLCATRNAAFASAVNPNSEAAKTMAG
ncbi:MAG: hypothetical protein U1E89_16280 [Burkholderiaceae bacterium]